MGDEFLKSWIISKNLALHIFKYYSEDDDDNAFIVFIKSHFKLKSSNQKMKSSLRNILKVGRKAQIGKTN